MKVKITDRRVELSTLLFFFSLFIKLNNRRKQKNDTRKKNRTYRI